MQSWTEHNVKQGTVYSRIEQCMYIYHNPNPSLAIESGLGLEPSPLPQDVDFDTCSQNLEKLDLSALKTRDQSAGDLT